VTVHIPVWLCWCLGVSAALALLMVTHFLAWNAGADHGICEAIDLSELDPADQPIWYRDAVKNQHAKKTWRIGL
jgi:hypothetical protein